MEKAQRIIYLTGPSCAPEEKELQEAMAAILAQKGYLPYLPWRDGLEGHLHLAAASGKTATEIAPLSKASFALEMFQILSRCHALIFNMNGRVPDEGGVFKTAAAFTAGKPVVIYKRDHRTAFHGADNSMVLGLSHSFKTVSTLASLPRALHKAFLKTPAAPDQQAAISPQQQSLIEMGGLLWKHLQRQQGAAPSFDKIEQALRIISAQ